MKWDNNGIERSTFIYSMLNIINLLSKHKCGHSLLYKNAYIVAMCVHMLQCILTKCRYRVSIYIYIYIGGERSWVLHAICILQEEKKQSVHDSYQLSDL